MTDRHNLNFVVGSFDGDALPVPEASIDVVVCNQVYEHVDAPIALLRNIYRALVPGGVCYFAGPNLLWPIEPHVFWPAVHWLPRRHAQALMRKLGSLRANELDAYSAHYWRLLRWFRSVGFVPASGLRSRVAVELRMRGHERGAALVSRIPDVLFRFWTPFSPGFVFLLRKPRHAANVADY